LIVQRLDLRQGMVERDQVQIRWRGSAAQNGNRVVGLLQVKQVESLLLEQLPDDAQ
jgi:hypothetical protein